MVAMIADDVCETSNAPGTSTNIDLNGAADGPFKTWRSRFSTGASVYYKITDGADPGIFEAGAGTLTYGSPDQLARTTVISNSTGNTARMNFTGSVFVYSWPPAERVPLLDATGNYLPLPGNPASALQATPKQYVDAAVATRLATAGGTIIGSLTLTGALAATGEVQAGQAFKIAISGAYFNSNTTNTQVIFDSALWRLEYVRATGALQYTRGSDNIALWSVGPTGNSAVAGQFTAGTNVVAAAGNVYARGGTSLIGPSDIAYIQTDSATYTNFVAHSAGYRLQFNFSDATWRIYRNDNAVLFSVNNAGDGTFAGTLNVASGATVQNATVTGNLTSGYIRSFGNIDVDDQLVANNIDAADTIQAGNLVGVGGSVFAFFRGGSGHVFQFSTNWYWDWNNTTGTISWVSPSGPAFSVQSDFTVSNHLGPMAATAFVVTSDERVKENIQPSPLGLQEIMQIEPITFTRVGKDVVEDGFSAQRLQKVMPTAVVQVLEGSDTLSINTTVLLAALVNAVKTLEARVSALEAAAA